MPVRAAARSVLAVGLLLMAALGATAPAMAQQKSSSGDLARRMDRLEQKLDDLQVMVGTLESLVRSQPAQRLPEESGWGASPSSGSGGGASDARVDALETQINALTSQLQQVTGQMQDLQDQLSGTAQPQMQPAPGRQGSAAPVATPSDETAWNGGPSSQATPYQQQGFDAQTYQQQSYQQDNSFRTMQANAAGYGTAKSEGEELGYGDSGSFGPDGQPASGSGWSDGSVQTGSMASLEPSDGARQIYERGYGDMLAHDYAAAEQSFRQVVEGYPADPLAGYAQYWLGESYYQRGQYKDAAQAFLTGYRSYKTSDKAPDSLLKLGMSLEKLGQKDAACSTYRELGTSFPMAPQDVQEQVQQQSRSAGCS